MYKSGFEILSINEGDKYHDELFVFTKQGDESHDIIINKKNYETQRKVFYQALKDEKRITYKIKKVFLKGFNLIVKIKKKFFPEPLKKRKNIC